jgi:hypothetical protein
MPEPSLIKEPNYRELAQKLFEKTSDGRLRWEKTPERGAFTVSIAGELFFTITASYLLMKDTDGEVVVYISVSDPNYPPEIREVIPQLYKLASHIATRVTEQVDKAIGILGHL